MLAFAAAVFLLIITPGPGVLSAAGFGSAYGFNASLRYVFGLFVGTNLVLIAVMSGLAAIVLSVPGLRSALMALSVCYLTFLAAKIALAGSRLGFIEAKSPPGVTAGVMLQLINPKAYAVNTSLVTGFGYAPDAFLYEMLTKALIMNAIWIPIHLAWLFAGVVLHRLNLPLRTQRAINMLMATSMIGVVALALWSAWSLQ
ncbi:MAG: LysE family transporter [Roseovarius sp.]|nr:LysE family transporter [Roseovarius sp.]MCY4315812.1 LysE family transporter [Roseovarius sp.]